MSMATNMGEQSSVQRPSSTSSGLRRNGLSTAAWETRRQKFSSAARAPSAPSPAKPSTSTAAFMAPAEVPEMPSMPSQGSSSRRSSTPQVNAPCAPPPCSAKSTRMGARLDATGPVVILLHQKVEPLPAGGPWWTDQCKNAVFLGDARGSSQRQQLEKLFLLRRRPGGG